MACVGFSGPCLLFISVSVLKSSLARTTPERCGVGGFCTSCPPAPNVRRALCVRTPWLRSSPRALGCCGPTRCQCFLLLAAQPRRQSRCALAEGRLARGALQKRARWPRPAGGGDSSDGAVPRGRDDRKGVSRPERSSLGFSSCSPLSLDSKSRKERLSSMPLRGQLRAYPTRVNDQACGAEGVALGRSPWLGQPCGRRAQV
jgi:hypothetical protein